MAQLTIYGGEVRQVSGLASYPYDPEFDHADAGEVVLPFADGSLPRHTPRRGRLPDDPLPLRVALDPSVSYLQLGRLRASVEPFISVGNATIGRRHSELRYDGGRWWVRHLGSTNGTFVNGAADSRAGVDGFDDWSSSQTLRHGDELIMGSLRARYGAELARWPALPSPLATDAGLEGAIVAEIDDAAALLVYGDWLQQQGDPRGELVAAQHAGSRQAESELLEAHSAYLLGGLERCGAAFSGGWRLGFLDRAVVRESAAVLARLLALPSARFLRRLELRDFDVYDALCALELFTATRELPPTLATLQELAFRVDPEPELDTTVYARGLRCWEPVAELFVRLPRARAPALRRLRLLGVGLSGPHLRQALARSGFAEGLELEIEA
jgi:uncharacterized protein (TIGR02996 family)